jgi:hypothetical protein
VVVWAATDDKTRVSGLVRASNQVAVIDRVALGADRMKDGMFVPPG